MATKTDAAKLKLVQPDLEQMEAAITEAASQTAPMTSRAVALANRQQAEVNALKRERADFEDRRSLLKAQFDAADLALLAHVTDIDDALALYPQQAE
jgi:predicted  nucleic acid-binding Zn-ribbon protein